MPRQKNPATIDEIKRQVQKKPYWGYSKYERTIDDAGAMRVATDMGSVDLETGLRKGSWPKTGDNHADLQMRTALEREGCKVVDTGTTFDYTLPQSDYLARINQRMQAAEARLKPKPKDAEKHKVSTGDVRELREATEPISTADLMDA